MKDNYVITANVKKFETALGRLHTRNRKSNRMALVSGDYGLGKTEAAVRFQSNHGSAIYLRIKALISPTWFLRELVKELGGDHHQYRTSDLFDQAQSQLDQAPRMVIVDEADYLLHDPRSMETLRDLHDTTPCSICIVGMGLMKNKLARYRHLFDRFSEIVDFTNLTYNDIRNVTTQNCEVKMSDDACDYMFRTTPRFRQIGKWMEKSELLAKTNGLKEITAEHIKQITKTTNLKEIIEAHLEARK